MMIIIIKKNFWLKIFFFFNYSTGNYISKFLKEKKYLRWKSSLMFLLLILSLHNFFFLHGYIIKLKKRDKKRKKILMTESTHCGNQVVQLTRSQHAKRAWPLVTRNSKRDCDLFCCRKTMYETRDKNYPQSKTILFQKILHLNLVKRI